MFKIYILVACLLAAIRADDDHFIDNCTDPDVNSVLLFNQEVSKDGKFQDTQEETIRIPESGFAPDVINCIQVNNLQSDDEGGYVKVSTGGIGKKYVTINFKSQFGKGYDFDVSVYCKGKNGSLVEY